jgi:preprotein translocase subunit SecD
VILTGESLTDAQPGFDSQNQQPKVDLTVDAKGGRIMRDTSRENLKQAHGHPAVRKGKGEVLTAPVIQGELGNRFQISGSMTVAEANDLALLLRAGSLAAPMEIIEERTIGPSLGAENIAKGFNSVTWGFPGDRGLHGAYYMLFGLFSGIALAVNLLLLVAILSMLQATLTLPGMAAMALALGMAIDSNVLINERVREELAQRGLAASGHHAGYDRAWATILDSNITTLIAGVALLAFGSGPVRGFAVVHCIGILTSMFSAVFFSRGLVNLWYGQKKAQDRLDRHRVAPGWRGRWRRRTATKSKGPTMEFFKIRKDIPFMRHALIFNVISFVTFTAAVFFLFSRGLHLSVEFTGGTVMEVSYSQPADLRKVRGHRGLGLPMYRCRTSARRAM